MKHELIKLHRSFVLGSRRIAYTDQKIRDFANLPVGWHYGEGKPPTQERIDQARTLNIEAALREFEKTNAFPGIDGEIQVTVYHGDLCLELTLELDNSVTVVLEDRETELAYEERLSFDEATRKISMLKERVWSSFGSSIQGTTTLTPSDSEVSPSNRRVMVRESQSLNDLVPSLTAGASVATLPPIIPRLRDRPPSTGTFLLRSPENSVVYGKRAVQEIRVTPTSPI